MGIVKLKKSNLTGETVIPPSKSAAHRAMICSFLAGGGNVSPISDSNDMKAALQVFEAIRSKSDIVDCIESGNVLRFMIPVAAALGHSCTFIGSGRLPQRPIGEYLRLLPEHNVQCRSEGGLPLFISGKLNGGVFEIAGDISSQYITGLLLALPLLEEDSEIVLTTPLQSKPYVDMTLKVMSDFGVAVQETEKGYFVKGNQKYLKRDYVIEPDWSHAAFFLTAGAIGGDVTLCGMNFNSTQGDMEIVDILKRFGADIAVDGSSIRCKKSALKGIEINVSDIPDTVPALAVTAAFAQGKTVIYGGERLRYKESDRIESVVTNLKKLGVRVDEKPDGMIIYGGNVKGGSLKGYNDHRIVMAFSVAGAYADGETTIDEWESINKTYPNFFDDYNALGGKADVISDM